MKIIKGLCKNYIYLMLWAIFLAVLCSSQDDIICLRISVLLAFISLIFFILSFYKEHIKINNKNVQKI